MKSHTVQEGGNISFSYFSVTCTSFSRSHHFLLHEKAYSSQKGVGVVTSLLHWATAKSRPAQKHSVYTQSHFDEVG